MGEADRVNMGCGGSEEHQEARIDTEKEDDRVEIVEEAPPEGWVQVDVLCDKHVLRMYVGPEHLVKNLIEYTAATLSGAETYEGSCEVKGLTSTWALEDGGLVFCEDDSIFELDGWDSKKSDIQLVAMTDNTAIDAWQADGAIPKSDDGFTVIE